MIIFCLPIALMYSTLESCVAQTLSHWTEIHAMYVWYELFVGTMCMGGGGVFCDYDTLAHDEIMSHVMGRAIKTFSRAGYAQNTRWGCGNVCVPRVLLNQHPALRLSFGRLNGGLFGLGDYDTLTCDEIMSYLNRDLIAVSPNE